MKDVPDVVRLKPDIVKRLMEEGRMRETFSQVVERVLDELETCRKRKEKT